MKKKNKIIVLIVSIVLFLILFGIWIHFVGLGASILGGYTYDLQKYIEEHKMLPKNVAELEKYYGYKINHVKFNLNIPIDDVVVKNEKLYLNGKKIWLVKLDGIWKYSLNVISPILVKQYSYDIYKTYQEVRGKPKSMDSNQP